MAQLEHEHLRKSVIGGSEVAALFDLNPYLSLFKLWHTKKGNMPPFEGNATTNRGKYFEDGVARWTADVMGASIVSPNVFLTRSDMAGLGGTPDRYITIDEETGVLECKTMNQWAAESWTDKSVPPPHYAMQTELYVHLKGAKFGILSIYVFGDEKEPYIFRIQPNPETRRLMVEGAAAFWKSIAEDKEPAPSASDLPDLVEKKNSKKASREYANLSENNYLMDLCATYIENKDKIDALEMEQDRIKAEVTKATIEQNASNFHAGAFQGIFSERSGTPDKIITPDMVGQTIKGRKGSTSLTIKRRKS